MVEIASVFNDPDFVPATVEYESVFTQIGFEPDIVTIDSPPPTPELVDTTTAEQKG